MKYQDTIAILYIASMVERLWALLTNTTPKPTS